MASPGPLFTHNENVGLFVLTAMASLSAAAIIGLLSYIAYSAVCILPGSTRRWKLGGPTEVYFLNQLGWDLAMATGGLMNIKWGIDKTVGPGPYCSAQGAIKQISDVGSAMSTLIISIYTLRVVCFWRVGDNDKRTECTRETESERRRNLFRSLLIVAFLWCSLGILVTINVTVDGVHRFYGPAGYWCWIEARYSIQRTATDFGFMWMTAFVNIAVYGILFLYFKGHITTNGWHIQLFREPVPFHALMPLKRVYGLLFYPIIYTLTILPLSIARYSTFAHHEVPFHVTIAVDAIYLSNGFLNVILFSLTRPYLLPHKPRVVSMVAVSGSEHLSKGVVSSSSFGGANDRFSSFSAHESGDHRPQVESPTLCNSPECERPIQALGSLALEKNV